MSFLCTIATWLKKHARPFPVTMQSFPFLLANKKIPIRKQANVYTLANMEDDPMHTYIRKLKLNHRN